MAKSKVYSLAQKEPSRKVVDPETRFWEKIKVHPLSCWVWTARANNKHYGCFWNGEAEVLAHRWAYAFYVGEIPEGLQLDHLCRNTLCVNPAHLEAVTPRENYLRGESPPADNARKTSCNNGHPLSGGNLYVDPVGKRCCMECRRRARRDSYHRRKRIPHG